MARRGRPRHPDILTPREWDVLALLREGATNEQIASRLGITERTAKFHVSEILGKLGVSSREEAAAWQPEARRPWWLAAGAPFVFIWRRSAGTSLKAFEIAIGTAMVAAVVAGIVLLAVLLARGGGSPGAVTSVEPLIAFSAGGGIYTVRPDGSELRKVVAGDRQPIWNAAPALSPDGSRIAYTRDYNIQISNVDGSGARELAAVRDLQTPPNNAGSNFSTGAQSIAWSPDGKHIAYVLGRIGGSGVQELWLMNANGSERTELSRSGGVWEQPVWLDNDRVSIYVPGKVRVFNTTGAEEDAIPFAATGDFSFAAMPALPIDEDEWLVGPITAEGPITLGSANAGRKTVATGIAPALAPGGAAFAYFAGDTLHVAEIGGSADEQIVDLAPLGGRDRFFGEQPDCLPNSSPACSYRLPGISWVGSAEASAAYIPAKTYRDDGLGIELKYPGAWVEGAPLRSWDLGDLHAWPCSNCVAFGPSQATPPHGVYVYAGSSDEPDCIVDKAWRCPVAARAHGGIDAVQQGDERHISVASEDAGQAAVLRYVPLSVRNVTGESTPDDEIWTIVPLGNRALYVVAFWRDGDIVGEQETRAGYDVVLKSLVIRPQQ